MLYDLDGIFSDTITLGPRILRFSAFDFNDAVFLKFFV